MTRIPSWAYSRAASTTEFRLLIDRVIGRTPHTLHNCCLKAVGDPRIDPGCAAPHQFPFADRSGAIAAPNGSEEISETQFSAFGGLARRKPRIRKRRFRRVCMHGRDGGLLR